MIIRNKYFFVIPFLLISTILSAQPSENNQINNLRAFAKLYGYVRFFHPSDESANLDWDKFAVLGVEKVFNCHDIDELKKVLKNLFYPIAPTMSIYSNNTEIEKEYEQIKNDNDTNVMDEVAWQHYGVWLGENSNNYRSYRVLRNDPIIKEDEGGDIKKIDRNIRKMKLFENFPMSGSKTISEIYPGLYCSIPLTLYSDHNGTKGKRNDYPFQSIIEKIQGINLDTLTAKNLSVRLSGVIIAWNVYEHFYPYFDEINVEWEKILRESLKEAIEVNKEPDYLLVLKRLTASLCDGHAFVNNAKLNNYNLPIRFAFIENKIIIAASYDENLKPGDLLVSIDGKNADVELEERKRHISGSPQYKLVSALNDLGLSSINIDAELIIIRNGERKEVKIKRGSNGWVQEFRHNPVMKIDDGIYYININYAGIKAFTSIQDELKNARGIIFDVRYEAMPVPGDSRINFWGDILWRIGNKEYKSANWLVPQIIYPSRNGIKFVNKQWSVMPYSENYKCPLVFIVDENCISSKETFMGIVEYYKIGEIVGSTTAGANGNSNWIPLPGGYSAGFTGMKTLKHDYSQHHLIGIKPNYPVKRTLAAVLEKRDEYLEKAIAVIKSKIKK